LDGFVEAFLRKDIGLNMFYTQIQPDSGDVNGAGHVGFSVLPIWFEKGFEGIYKIVNATDKSKQGAVIVARLEVNYLAEVYGQGVVTIETGVAGLGKSSFTLAQQLSTSAYQNVQQSRFIAERDKAVQKLRRNEENLRITLNSIGDAVMATDTRGRITHMNPVAEL